MLFYILFFCWLKSRYLKRAWPRTEVRFYCDDLVIIKIRALWVSVLSVPCQKLLLFAQKGDTSLTRKSFLCHIYLQKIKKRLSTVR